MFISHVRGPWISMKQGCIMILTEKSDTRRREAIDCQERIRLRRHCDQRLFHGGGETYIGVAWKPGRGSAMIQTIRA